MWILRKQAIGWSQGRLENEYKMVIINLEMRLAWVVVFEFFPFEYKSTLDKPRSKLY